MNAKQLIAQEAEQMPEFLLGEVLDFMQFLKQKYRLVNLETMGLSQASLKKDGLTELDNKPFPKFGSAKGLVKMSDDFDEPLEDFEEYAP